jgi:putative transposase
MMKKKPFSEDQHIAGAHGRLKTTEWVRKYGISKAALNNRKARFGGMDVSEVARLRARADETSRPA